MKKSNIIGTYVSKEVNSFLADVPHNSDTLVLKSDGTFSSNYYGNGTYSIDYTFFNTRINLNYEYEMGEAGYHTYFSNKIYEKPKIILNYDLNHYYEKVPDLNAPRQKPFDVL